MGLFGVSIGEIGFKALASSALKKAGSGIAGFFKWLGSLDAIHVLLLCLAIFVGWQTFGRWSQHRYIAKVEAQLTTASNALTDAKKQLAASQTNETALTKAIADQNAAIADLGAKSAQQQAAAQEAIKSATTRANDAAASAQRLRASAAQRPSSAATGPCEPLQAVKDQWGAK